MTIKVYIKDFDKFIIIKDGSLIFSSTEPNLVKAFITAVFWLSGIMWDPANVKGKALKIFLRFNPVTYLVNGYRNCFINKVWFWEEPKRLMYFGIICVVLFAIGIFTYKRVRKDIPDVL